LWTADSDHGAGRQKPAGWGRAEEPAAIDAGDRVARAMLTSLTVEHDLSRIGVEVVYANEPTGGTESGRLRLRRYSQVEAEVYRTVMMEMSMGG
jgi:hypothetical protein